MKNRFNWKKSKGVFDVFEVIYDFPGSSLSEISTDLNRIKSTVSEQINALKVQGFIKERYDNREKVFWIKKEEVMKKCKRKNLSDLNYAIIKAKSFNDLINAEELGKYKELGYTRGPLFGISSLKRALRNLMKKENKLKQQIKMFENK